MNPMVRMLRQLGIFVGLAFLGFLLWVAVVGPAILILLKPHS
jgi:hypothetical protein